MAAVIDIANQALARVGDNRITALTEATKQARAVNAAWPIVRDEVLRSHSWNCVGGRARIAALTAAPDFGYDKQFQLPADCLRVLEVVSSDNSTDITTRWVVEGRALLADHDSPINIRYTRKEEDTGVYDPQLVGVLVARLAAEISEELTQSTSKNELRWKEFKDALRDAKRTDGLEMSPMPFVEDDWVLARDAGSSGVSTAKTR